MGELLQLGVGAPEACRQPLQLLLRLLAFGHLQKELLVHRLGLVGSLVHHVLQPGTVFLEFVFQLPQLGDIGENPGGMRTRSLRPVMDPEPFPLFMAQPVTEGKLLSLGKEQGVSLPDLFDLLGMDEAEPVLPEQLPRLVAADPQDIGADIDQQTLGVRPPGDIRDIFHQAAELLFAFAEGLGGAPLRRDILQDDDSAGNAAHPAQGRAADQGRPGLTVNRQGNLDIGKGAVCGQLFFKRTGLAGSRPEQQGARLAKEHFARRLEKIGKGIIDIEQAPLLIDNAGRLGHPVEDGRIASFFIEDEISCLAEPVLGRAGLLLEPLAGGRGFERIKK